MTAAKPGTLRGQLIYCPGYSAHPSGWAPAVPMCRHIARSVGGFWVAVPNYLAMEAGPGALCRDCFAGLDELEPGAIMLMCQPCARGLLEYHTQVASMLAARPVIVGDLV